MPAFVVPGKCAPRALVSTQPVLWASVPAFVMFCRGISKPPLMSKSLSRSPRSILSLPLMISSFNLLSRQGTIFVVLLICLFGADHKVSIFLLLRRAWLVG